MAKNPRELICNLYRNVTAAAAAWLNLKFTDNVSLLQDYAASMESRCQTSQSNLSSV